MDDYLKKKTEDDENEYYNEFQRSLCETFDFSVQCIIDETLTNGRSFYLNKITYWLLLIRKEPCLVFYSAVCLTGGNSLSLRVYRCDPPDRPLYPSAGLQFAF